MIKEKYVDVLFFFCMGDFYELFFEDVVCVVEIFDIILMLRGEYDGYFILMVGVFYYVVEGYFVCLIKLGECVVVCE